MSFGLLYISYPGGRPMLNDLDIDNIRNLDDALDVIRNLLNLVETFRQENLELKRQNHAKGDVGSKTI